MCIRDSKFGNQSVYAYNLASVNGSTANLTIWDSTDSETGFIDKQINFYANYTNKTSGAAITGASCNITFSDGLQNMVWNATSQLYEYNRTFSTSGLKEYNVTCNHTNYESLTTNDNINVYGQCQQAFLSDLGSGNDWNITGTTTIECNDTELYFNNQDVNVLDKDYLKYLVKTKLLLSELNKLAEGATGRKRVSIMDILNLKIPLPSLDTQRKIVEELDKEMQALEKVKLLKEKAEKRIEEILEEVWRK